MVLSTAEKRAESLVSQSSNNPKKTDTGSALFFQLMPFRDNELGVNHRHALLQNFTKVSKQITFFVIGNRRAVKMYAQVPASLSSFVRNQFFAAYPTSDMIATDAPTLTSQMHYIHTDTKTEIATKEYFVQDGSYIDPMKDVLTVFGSIPKESTLILQYGYRFRQTSSRSQKVRKTIKKGADLARNGAKTDEKDAKSSTPDDSVQQYQQNINEVFLSLGCGFLETDGMTTEVVMDELLKTYGAQLHKGKIKRKPKSNHIPMSRSQAVNFFHIPTKVNFVQGLEYAVFRKLPYPSNLPTPQNTESTQLAVLGKTDYKSEKVIFGIKDEDKFRHVYVVGKTGTGKSTFLSNMIKSDMHAGKGLCLIDPHGDLVDTVMEHVPSFRVNDVVLFDIGDQDFPIGFNLLQYKTEEEKLRVVSGVVGVFHKMFGHSRGPRLEYILRNVLLTLVDYPNATILHLLRVLTDKNFREEVLSHLQDQVVLKFRRNEFDKRQDRQVQDAIGPITNKVGQFLSSSIVRNIFGQPNSKLNMREAMDSGKIILVNLSKGRIGEDNAKMIGSLLVTKIEIDAMSRADIPASERKDFMLYIDEFQNFATESFATILSEARKYRLSLIVANQYTSQLDEVVRDAIFGNVGTVISFTLGRDDAEVMSKQFKEIISPNDLLSLPKFNAYIKLMIDGVMSDPFNMWTLPLPTPEQSQATKDKIRRQSHQRYAMERGRLESLLDARSKKNFSKQEAIAHKAKLEGLGLTPRQVDASEDLEVERRQHLFRDYSIAGVEPDQIIFDLAKGMHKAVRYAMPQDGGSSLILETKKTKGATFQIQGHELRITLDMYQHTSLHNEATKPLEVWIGTASEVEEQLAYGFTNTARYKPLPNIDKLTTEQPSKKTTAKSPRKAGSTKKKLSSQKTQSSPSTGFSIADISVGQRYEGYVKLIYNYGIFVTVKGVEGLLHKNEIVVPDGVKFKDYYNIGDKIRIRADDFKEVKGEKKVVWSQKEKG